MFVSEEAEMCAQEPLSHEYNWLEACSERMQKTAAVCLTEMYGAAEQSYAKKSAAAKGPYIHCNVQTPECQK